MDLLEVAQARIAALRKELRIWEEWAARARELMAQASPAAGELSFNGQAPTVHVARAEVEGKGQKIARLTREHIAAHGPVQTVELVSILRARGIQFGEQPRGEVASWLNKAGIFESRRSNGGWFLKEEAPADESPAGAGSLVD